MTAFPFHAAVLAAVPHLLKGLAVSLGNYGGFVRPDSEGVSIDTPRTFEEEGVVRLASQGSAVPDGPTIRHEFRVRADRPGIELDLEVTNGEITGPRTPHLMTDHLLIKSVPGMAIVPRFDWIKVERLGANLFRVDLGARVLQGVLLNVELALVPDFLVSDTEIHPAVREALRSPSWLRLFDRPFVDNLVRWSPEMGGDPGYLDAVREKARADAIALFSGEYKRELSYLPGDYGAWGSGTGIRFDYGAEFEEGLGSDKGLLYRFMHRWGYEVQRRPQRGFLTENGVPWDGDGAKHGFKMVVGPTEIMFPNESSNPYGFDEQWVRDNAGSFKGTIDNQHGTRAWQMWAYLAQRFECPVAKRMVLWHANAARTEIRDVLRVGSGYLDRGEAWGTVINAVDSYVNGTKASKALCESFVEAHARDQTVHGGVCRWDHNKEALDYAREFVAQSQGIPIEQVPVEPVTQTYHETIILYALRCCHTLGIGGGSQAVRMSNGLEFVARICRPKGAPFPWYRTTPSGERRSSNASSYYYGLILALARATDHTRAGEWLQDFTAGAGDPFGWLTHRKVSSWNNSWHLLGALRGE